MPNVSQHGETEENFFCQLRPKASNHTHVLWRTISVSLPPFQLVPVSPPSSSLHGHGFPFPRAVGDLAGQQPCQRSTNPTDRDAASTEGCMRGSREMVSLARWPAGPAPGLPCSTFLRSRVRKKGTRASLGPWPATNVMLTVSISLSRPLCQSLLRWRAFAGPLQRPQSGGCGQ
ncbi:hypothetical protein GQ53DRAFT_180492 [Thozetella sp. PMI_491]|nr:hypothetical protein GQ53DRAFT_180492 [Thozetella sp. PMI_491]